jgi:hypothetical protein
VNAVGPGVIFTPFHAECIAASGEGDYPILVPDNRPGETVEQYNAKAAQGTDEASGQSRGVDRISAAANSQIARSSSAH